MKRKYSSPSIKVANIILPTLLADSIPVIDETENTGGWGSAQSKGASLFDNNEE